MKMKKFDLRIIVSLIASTFFLSVFTHPSNAVVGDESLAQVRILFDIAFIVVATFTAGYLLLMLFYLLRYRNSNSRDVSVWSLKKQNKYILAWTIIVICLVATETLVEAPVTDFVTSPPENGQPVDGVINVVAHQFQFMVWLQNGTSAFNAPSNCLNFDPTCQNVTIQAGKTYMVNITSIDVIHSFFLFEFGYKLDAVPGRLNVFYLKISSDAAKNTQPKNSDGSPAGYEVICSEFCGPGHFTMAQDTTQGGGAARIIVTP